MWKELQITLHTFLNLYLTLKLQRNTEGAESHLKYQFCIKYPVSKENPRSYGGSKHTGELHPIFLLLLIVLLFTSGLYGLETQTDLSTAIGFTVLIMTAALLAGSLANTRSTRSKEIKN